MKNQNNNSDNIPNIPSRIVLRSHRNNFIQADNDFCFSELNYFDNSKKMVFFVLPLLNHELTPGISAEASKMYDNKVFIKVAHTEFYLCVLPEEKSNSIFSKDKPQRIGLFNDKEKFIESFLQGWTPVEPLPNYPKLLACLFNWIQHSENNNIVSLQSFSGQYIGTDERLLREELRCTAEQIGDWERIDVLQDAEVDRLITKWMKENGKK